MGLIQKIKSQNFTWTHITNPNLGSIEYLRQNHNFHPFNLDDCLAPTLRAKIEQYDNYSFIVLNFPYFDRNSRAITLSEVDIFIGSDFIITLNDKKLEPITRIFETCQRNETEREKYIGQGISYLLYQLLNELQKYCSPILNHISQDMQNIENQIFNHQERKMVNEILIVKRNIVNFRKSVQSHKNVMKKLSSAQNVIFENDKMCDYFNNLLEQSKEIWEMLENQKENIEALHNTNESLISFKLNSIMKTLTIISVTLMPLTLVSSTFGMNYIIPFQKQPWGFFFAISLMTIFTLIILSIFKKKKWLD